VCLHDSLWPVSHVLDASRHSCSCGLAERQHWRHQSEIMPLSITIPDLTLLQSMVGELTDSTNMAQAFGIMPVIWATGITIASVHVQNAQNSTDKPSRPLIGGVLSRPYERFPNVFGGAFWHKYPYFLPCFASACFSALSFLLALSFLEEVGYAPQVVDACSCCPRLFKRNPQKSPTSNL
jgi:hypothetical protein